MFLPQTFLHCHVSAVEVVIITGPVLSFRGGKPVLDHYSKTLFLYKSRVCFIKHCQTLLYWPIRFV